MHQIMTKTAGLLACLLLLCYGLPLRAQGPVTVTGIVKDKLSHPLDGVSVQVIGTQRGATTDTMGKFTIRVDNPKQQLRFSRVGYVAQTIGFTNNVSIEVVLEAQEGSADEVVVVGYGQQKKISLVGAQ